MKKFKDRIKYYIIGFGMGIIAVAFLFGERGCAWLPENRVKNTIAESEIIYGDSIKALMVCSSLTSAHIYDMLNAKGDVDFSESTTDITPKEYQFYGENDLKVRFAIYKGYSEVIAIDSKCGVVIHNTHKQSLPLPKQIVSSIIESHDFMFYPEAEDELKCYGLTKDQILNFHKTALINMPKSKAWPKGKGENVENKLYYLDGQIDGKSYGIMYEIGENRTRIKHVIGLKSCVDLN